MHQPHADRNVSPHQPVADKRWPLPRFPIGQGRAGDRTSGRLPHSAPGLHTGQTKITVLQPHSFKHKHASLSGHFALPRDNHRKPPLTKSTYQKRRSKDEPLVRNTRPPTSSKRERQPTQTRDSIGSLFSPLRFPPVRPASEQMQAR